MGQIRAWLIERADSKLDDAAREVTAKAKKASAAARAPEAVAKAKRTRAKRAAERSLSDPAPAA